MLRAFRERKAPSGMSGYSSFLSRPRSRQVAVQLTKLQIHSVCSRRLVEFPTRRRSERHQKLHLELSMRLSKLLLWWRGQTLTSITGAGGCSITNYLYLKFERLCGSDNVWAFWMRQCEVLGQDWKIHPEDLAEILELYPRFGFGTEAYSHLKAESAARPHSRFGTLNPVLPFMMRRSRFPCSHQQHRYKE